MNTNIANFGLNIKSGSTVRGLTKAIIIHNSTLKCKKLLNLES
jgi:hypothetical protein